MRCAGCTNEIEAGDRFIRDVPSGFMGRNDDGLDGLMATLLGGAEGKTAAAGSSRSTCPRRATMPRSVELYDLSRLLDRVRAVEDELYDVAVSTVDGCLMSPVMSKANMAMHRVQILKMEIEGQIGGPDNYRPEVAPGA